MKKPKRGKRINKKLESAIISSAMYSGMMSLSSPYQTISLEEAKRLGYKYKNGKKVK